MRVFLTHPRNVDRFFEVADARVTDGWITYRYGGLVVSRPGREGDRWHLDQMSAARKLMENRARKIADLEAEVLRLRSLPDAVAEAADEAVATVRGSA